MACKAEDKLGEPIFAGVFMDHRGSRFRDDLLLLEDSGLLSGGAAVVADNVLKPGAPLLLWHLARSRGVHAQFVSVPEFLMPAEDWMSVSTRCPLAAAEEGEPVEDGLCGQARTEVLNLDREADRMREKALNPGRSVTFEEWAAFAAGMTSCLGRVGIAATSAVPG
eukprot:CAMPEP_0168474510 /NCGR_PEP_ID=MMETSP0228-20121227/60883_1 /TAXON_ID=133427 /ORGANISM="Protoceratium reticulatum, Strain CCCM 535 (=CCMP 1889)" /LENGTH=165 /DNA_ID=CAMNT_0008490549 /DNA_START=33 /DNA_END=528 /DNA_ORIENTATION=-